MFIVIEIQHNKNGTVGIPAPASYEDRGDAENKYHSVLAAAAKSGLPKHSAVMLNEGGVPIKYECYTNETEEQDGE